MRAFISDITMTEVFLLWQHAHACARARDTGRGKQTDGAAERMRSNSWNHTKRAWALAFTVFSPFYRSGIFSIVFLFIVTMGCIYCTQGCAAFSEDGVYFNLCPV